MNEVSTVAILFAAVGMLFILISIPLILERVPPNNFYGRAHAQDAFRSENLV